MKTRNSFVANSSSSSFIIISAGDDIIKKSGYPCEDSDSTSIPIDEMITKLQEAKAKGITIVDIEYGGEYNG